MATVGVVSGSLQADLHWVSLQVDSQPGSFGLVWGSAAVCLSLRVVIIIIIIKLGALVCPYTFTVPIIYRQNDIRKH